jgi:NAD(P)-dependent dehydrogenase (short-subunit alcohol dehydrogenase family)
LQEEYPNFLIKSIDLCLDEPAGQLTNQILAEIAADDDVIEVGYKDGKRYGLELVRTNLETRKNSLNLDSSMVILITGGARGITAEVALDLAQRYQPTLILAGLSPPPPEREAEEFSGLSQPQELKTALIAAMQGQKRSVKLTEVEAAYRQLLKEREIRNNLAAMEATGAAVSYVQVDVRNPRAFSNLIEEIYETYGRLDGVIHGAGIIADKLIKDKSLETFKRVLGTKTESAFILSRSLRPETLKFLVMFSSVAGRFGNPGQCDYTAANEVINKLAVYLDRRWPGKVVAINWGPWDQSGMVSPELKKKFAQRQVQLIASKAGCQSFHLEILKGQKGEAEVVLGNWLK